MASPGQTLGAVVMILLHRQQTREMLVNARRSARPKGSDPSVKLNILGQSSEGILAMSGSRGEAEKTKGGSIL